MMKWKILVTDDIRLEGIDEPDATIDYRPGMAAAELLEVIKDYDALITRSRTRVNSDVLTRAKRLKVIGRGGVGVDNIDLEAASRRGILVTNAPEANTRSAAELAFALMLAAARGVTLSDRKIRSGTWDRKAIGLELMGKTLGIVGLGRIGSQMSRFAKHFEMQVLAYDPYIPRIRGETVGATLVDTLEELLRSSDVLTVHTPLNDETRGMIGRRELYLMPKNSVVVNAARGGIVNEEALLELLDEGHLFGVGLDVFGKEPPSSDDPLVTHPLIVHTAHLGANTMEAQQRVGPAVVERVMAALRGDYSFVINAGFDPEAFQALEGFIPLGETLGKVLKQITRGRNQSVEVEFYGDFKGDPQPIATAVAKGMLEGVLSEGVNFVSAVPLLKERGIRLTTKRDPESRGTPNPWRSGLSRTRRREVSMAPSSGPSRGWWGSTIPPSR